MKGKIYRLSLVDNDSGEKIRSVRFRKRHGIEFIVLLTLLLAGLFYCIFAFTPLRSSIPGYPDSETRRKAVENAMRIDSLEASIQRWELYALNISRVLRGEERVEIDSVVKGVGSVRFLSDKTPEELAVQDSLLSVRVKEADRYTIIGSPRTSLPIEGIHFFSPLSGAVLRKFDVSTHCGIDVSVPRGSVVCSVLDGSVVFVGWEDNGGYTVVVSHPDDVLSIYRHNGNILVGVGDRVAPGTSLAVAGEEQVTGGYVHFELWYKGEAVDPEKYISF